VGKGVDSTVMQDLSKLPKVSPKALPLPELLRVRKERADLKKLSADPAQKAEDAKYLDENPDVFKL
jgi:hypothetical protein